MPNRPNRVVSLIPAYVPQAVQDTSEREIQPVISAKVNSAIPTNNVTPAVLANNTSTEFALFRFDLRGLAEGLVTLNKVMLTWGCTGGANNQATYAFGIMNNADAASWTAAATWNTKDGAVAWTGGAGGFRQVGSEVTWTVGKMPGVTVGSQYCNDTVGINVPGAGLYHPKYDDNLVAVQAAIASLMNTALEDQSGFINVYLKANTVTTNGTTQGDLSRLRMQRIRLMIWDMEYMTTTGFFGAADAAMFRFPPNEVYDSASPSNSGCLGASVFDMTTLDDLNATTRAYNYHGGISSATSTFYLCDSNVGTSRGFVIMKFDLREFMGTPFSKVLLRLTGGNQGGVTSTGGTIRVAQFKDDWIIGDGGLASSTFGPTFNHQNKMGSVAWPSGTPSGAGAIDTVGQAETLFTNLNPGAFGDAASSGSNFVVEADITAMANRALTTYGGFLRLRVRTTYATGTLLGVIQGPALFAETTPGSAKANQEVMGNSSIGYNGWPRLLIRTEDPAP